MIFIIFIGSMFIPYTVDRKFVKFFNSMPPLYIVSTLNADPNAEPDGLLPKGFPPRIGLPPFGTIGNSVTFAVVDINY